MPLFTGKPATEEVLKAFNDNLKLANQLIGDNKYLLGDHLTIADLSVLATTSGLISTDHDFTDIPNVKRWIKDLISTLPYYSEINNFEPAELMAYFGKIKEFLAKSLNTNF